MPAWAIPPYVIQFTGAQPIVSFLPVPSSGTTGIDYSGQSAKFYSNAFHDAQGNLRFFIVDGNIYDKHGYVIELSDNLLFPEFANPELLVVPVPESFCKYYLIYTDGLQDGCNPNIEIRLGYNILDICEQNSNNPYAEGKLLLSENSIQPELKLAAGRRLKQVEMAVQGPNTNGNYYLFLYARFDLYLFEITSNGIIQLNNTVNFLHFNTGSGYQMHLMDNNTEMEAILLQNGNYRVALNFAYLEDGNPNPRGHIYWTADFDDQLVLIPATEKHYKNATETYINYPKGMEFSPDGNLLYITQRNSVPALQYFVLSQFQNGPIPLPVNNAQIYEQGFIELGYDGNMYVASSNGLGILSNPNNPNKQNWSELPLPLESVHKSVSPCHIRREVYALPDQIDGFIYTGLPNTYIQKINILIYPNPATGIVTIELPAAGVLEIYSVDGKILLYETVSKGMLYKNISHLHSGIYLLRFISEEGVSVKRLQVYNLSGK
jgi:hypothetical protein